MANVHHYSINNNNSVETNIMVNQLQMQKSCEDIAKIIIETKKVVNFKMDNVTKESITKLMQILEQNVMNQCFQAVNNDQFFRIAGYQYSGTNISLKCSSVQANLLKHSPEIVNQIQQLLQQSDKQNMLLIVQFPVQTEVTQTMQQNWLKQIDVFINDAQVKSNVSANYTYIWMKNYVQLELLDIKKLIINDKILIELSKKASRFHSKYIPNKTVFNLIINNLQKLNQNIQIELSQKFTQDDLQKSLRIIQVDYPEFWFVFNMNDQIKDGFVCDIELFQEDVQKIIQQNTIMMKEVEKVEKYLQDKGVIKEQYTPEQIIAFEHQFLDLMSESTIYQESTNSRAAHNAYGCFVEKKCVCQGYTAAFQLICDRAGLKLLSIFGDANSNGNYEHHVWNMIEIEEAFYHIDVTWCTTKSNQHKWFNVNDDYCYKTHKPNRSFFPVQVCNHTKYNYYQFNNRMVSEEGQFEKMIGTLANGEHQIFFQNISPQKYFNQQNYNDFYFGLQYDNKKNIELSDVTYEEDIVKFKISLGEPIKTEINGPGEYLLKLNIEELKKLMETMHFRYQYMSYGKYMKITLSK
ncbi:Transglutaminase-like_superfamily protein [Hexamita inflata]|uniref:Transglutaminase-like superfamily protein n=1 Tax=Hexamita inflata TaxID=28002 RepID=A0AA86QGA5_9EUKA|nr:Transglutaminase-like superfamily protein [Hexamita inflata]